MMQQNEQASATRRRRARTRCRRAARATWLAALAGAIALPGVAPVALGQTMPATMSSGDAAAAATTRPTTVGTPLPRGVTGTPQGLLLNFQDASIDTILNELSQSAGFIVVKEVKPEGRVTLVSRQPISPSEAVDLLNTVLRNAGYTAIQQERILKIVNKDAAKRMNIPVRTGNDPTQIPNTDELITQVIPLRFADATLLKTDLAPLIDTTQADFTSNASSNVLILTDTSSNVRRVVQIVHALDTSVADAVDVKVFTLKYADATSAATLINSVFANLNSARTQGSAAPGTPAGGGGGGGGFGGGGFGGGGFGGGGFGGGGFGGRGGFGGGGNNNNAGRQQQQRLVTAGADARTNSVVVSGQADTLAIVAGVIHDLDANPALDQTTFVYRLRNSQSVNVAAILNALFNGTAPPNQTQQDNAAVLNQARASNSTLSSGGSSGSGTRSTGGGLSSTAGRSTSSTGSGNRTGTGGLSSAAQNAAQSLSGQVSIIADTDSNSLLVRTSPTNYEQVKAILDEIDKPVAQVMIKVLIAEVTHENELDEGISFGALDLSPPTAGTGQTSLGPNRGVGTRFDIPTAAPTGTGLVVNVLEQNFNVQLRALELASRLEVLSRPYILASDNQLATITVGQEVPFIDSSRITDTGNQINTVDYRDVGILLDVIPHINPDGLVILDVAPEISTLNQSTNVQISQGVSAPVINKRSAQSRVSVRSGQTIVIGGLMQDQLNDTISKVPLLGDIPYLGELFKQRSRTKTKTELLIFLTPHIATQPADLDKMSSDEQKGMKLVPNSVGPGVFQEHMEGLRRGEADHPVGPSTQPTLADPTTKPAPEQIYDENRVRGDRRNFDRPADERKVPVDPQQP